MHIFKIYLLNSFLSFLYFSEILSKITSLSKDADFSYLFDNSWENILT